MGGRAVGGAMGGTMRGARWGDWGDRERYARVRGVRRCGDTHTFFTGCIIDNLGIDLTGIEDLEQLEVVVRKELSAKKGKAVFGNHLSPALAGQSQTEECLNAWSPDVPVVLFIPGHGTCAMNRKAREEYGFSPEACYAEALYKIMGIYLNDRDFVDDQLVEYMHMLNAPTGCDIKEIRSVNFFWSSNSFNTSVKP